MYKTERRASYDPEMKITFNLPSQHPHHRER